MRRLSPRESLDHRLRSLASDIDSLKSREMPNDVPSKWEKFDDVAIIPNKSFRDGYWDEVPSDVLWREVAIAIGVQRLYRKGEVDGPKRKPEIELLTGSSRGSWVIRKENGIRYGYDITNCMWSAGNVNERRRMGEVAKQGETVLDLFAGIGYYTLPILKSSSGINVIACEWNQASIESLRWNLSENGLEHQCTVIEGDCTETVPKLSLQVDRAVLGLLPDSTFAIPTAIGAFGPTGGMLHLHALSSSKDYDSQSKEIERKILDCSGEFTIGSLDVVRVKSYAPKWDHVVYDIVLDGREASMTQGE